MDKSKTNLFVYGSLRDSEVFKSVSGLGFSRYSSQTDPETLWAEPAFLDGYRRVSPDNVYYYAVADPASRIEGLVIHNVPAAAMIEIDRYEGKRYESQTVAVNTATGRVEAAAYLASHATMKKHFGDRFHVNLIHELWLRKRIEQFIKKSTRPGEHTLDADIERRAKREFLATTERDLVITHYRADAVNDFYLEQELNRPVPSIKSLFTDPDARPYIENYLAFVLRQVLLNQLDEKIQSQFRFELEHMRTSERYFKRSVSLLMALRMVNSSAASVDMMVRQGLVSLPAGAADLIDYVKYAVSAADGFFDIRIARAELERIRTNRQPGLTPMGAELELSNLGYRAITKAGLPPPECAPYCGFYYFYDFCLDVLTWKLGGYIDDHSGTTSSGRRYGFFELAPGRLNVAGELSRPATADPWLLNQLINEMVRFYNIAPHSLHLSFQMRKHQIGRQRVLPLEFVKCLLVLGGGIRQRHNGQLWVSRMSHNEIAAGRFGEELAFARTSKRRWFTSDAEIASKTPPHVTTQVYQYKFIRLETRANYEPLIMALKGLQLAYNPADYLSALQLSRSKILRGDYELLKQWADSPTPISGKTIAKFLSTVQRGLMNEHLHRSAHQLHYIDWALNSVDVQLRLFNKELQEAAQLRTS
jgi:gamma-glutamylcyclotransferase (GGCT)/AIG2-like uncharacterized protein YtfP